MWDLSFPRDGTAAVALEGSSLTHWTTGEVPVQFFFFFFFFKIFRYGPPFKLFIELVTILLHFYVLVFGRQACGILGP